MRLSDDELNSIRNSADIVEVIGHYIPVVKSGRNFKAVCPFHDDHDPSMNISTDKQIYKCFSCNAGGNVFTFVQNYENCSFIESVKKVAEISGYNITINLDSYEKPKDPLKDNYHKILNESIKFLKYSLNSSSSTLIKAYLQNRGIDNELIDRFDIGYNDNNDVLYRFLNAKGYKDIDLIKVNVARNSESGIHDVFTKRITFPIHDIFGNPIGFTARSLDENVAKYINTNETDLYTKGNIIYNFHRAKEESKRKNKVIIVEGVLDVIAFARAGINNVVATLGTACTQNQLNEMRKLSNTLVFCYDGDTAGKNANFKAAKLAIKNNFDVRVIDNKTTYDPDEIINKQGKDALINLLSKELTWLEFCFDYYIEKYNIEIYSEKKEFVNKVMEEINESNDEFDKQNFTHKLSQITGFKINDLPLKKIEKTKERNKLIVKNALEGRKAAERFIISNMLSSNEAIEMFISDLGFLVDDDCQIIAMMIIDEYRRNKTLKISNLLDMIDNDIQKQILLDISTDVNYSIEFNKEGFKGYINRIKKWILEDETEKLRQLIQKELDNDNKLKLMLKYRENLIELRRYNNG